MKITSKINKSAMLAIKKIGNECLEETAKQIKNDLDKSQTMPFDIGALQNRGTFVDSRDLATGKVYIVSDTPYARRLYFHPEFNFQKKDNRYAGGLWFEPYLNGDKKNLATEIFGKYLKRKMK